jgi:hypothetical protein
MLQYNLFAHPPQLFHLIQTGNQIIGFEISFSEKIQQFCKLF